MRIILLGPPGSGKGTQAKALSKKLNLKHISTGDILRQEVHNNSELGKEAKAYMDRGELVPDKLVTQIIQDRLRDKKTDSFILDGYPRNIPQAENLDEILLRQNKDIDNIIYLDASEQTIVQRLSGRRVCPKCNANFHIVNMPPKRDMVCDLCNVALYQRQDDTVSTIKNRLEVYLKESAPLIDYYAMQKKLTKVAADKEAEDVLAALLKLLRKDDSFKIRR